MKSTLLEPYCVQGSNFDWEVRPNVAAEVSPEFGVVVSYQRMVGGHWLAASGQPLSTGVRVIRR